MFDIKQYWIPDDLTRRCNISNKHSLQTFNIVGNFFYVHVTKWTVYKTVYVGYILCSVTKIQKVRNSKKFETKNDVSIDDTV